jgi:hypothetical protein
MEISPRRRKSSRRRKPDNGFKREGKERKAASTTPPPPRARPLNLPISNFRRRQNTSPSDPNNVSTVDFNATAALIGWPICPTCGTIRLFPIPKKPRGRPRTNPWTSKIERLLDRKNEEIAAILTKGKYAECYDSNIADGDPPHRAERLANFEVKQLKSEIMAQARRMRSRRKSKLRAGAKKAQLKPRVRK